MIHRPHEQARERRREHTGAVRFSRREDGAIVASTIVYPWSDDFDLFDLLERANRSISDDLNHEDNKS